MQLPVRRAAFTIHPSRVPIRIMLLLPDGQPNLDLINDVTASSECFITVRRGNPDPDGAFADLEDADPMHALRFQDGKFPGSLAKYDLALFHRERFVRFVFQSPDCMTVVFISYPALERCIGSRGGIAKLLTKFVGPDDLAGYAHHFSHRPPEETAG